VTEQLYFYLGPWVWSRELDGWEPPEGTVGALDLRPLAACAAREHHDRNVGLFVIRGERLSSDYVLLGGALDDFPPASARDAIIKLLGLNHLASARLSHIVAEVVSLRGDPLGQERFRPLLPTSRGRFEIHLSPFGRIWSRAFAGPQDPAWDGIRAVRQHDFAREFARSPDAARRFLGRLVRAYPVSDWHDLVPHELWDHVSGPLEPHTTITESWNCDDHSGLDCDLSWTLWRQTGGSTGWEVADHRARLEPGVTYVEQLARAEADLSGDDHYAQVSVVALPSTTNDPSRAMACVRFGSGGAGEEDVYRWHIHRESDDTYRVRWLKFVGGTTTGLGSGSVTVTPSFPVLLRGEADGSTLDGYLAGMLEQTVTDTSLAGQIRTGIVGRTQWGVTGPVLLDDFEAGDFAGGAMQEHRGSTIKVLTGGTDKSAGFDEVSVYPNSEGCSAVRGTCPVAVTPNGLTEWEETAYNSTELEKISTEGVDAVIQEARRGQYGGYGYKIEDPGHRVTLFIPSGYQGNACSKMCVTVGVYQSGANEYVAYIWNFDTSSWDNLDLTLEAEPEGFVSDTAEISGASAGSYIGSSYETHVLLVDDHPSIPLHASLDYVCVLYRLASATFHTGTIVAAVTGSQDSLKFRDHVGQVIRVRARGSDRQVYSPQNLGADLLVLTAGSDRKFFPPAHLGQIVLIVTGVEDAIREVQGTVVATVVGGDEHLIRRDHVGTVVAVLEGGMDVCSYEPDDDGISILVVTDGEDRWLRYENCGSVVHVLADGTDVAVCFEHKGTDVLVMIGSADCITSVDHGGSIVLVELGGAALHYLPVYLGVPGPGERELTWTAPNLPEGTVFWLLIDGRIAHRTAERSVRLPEGTEVRQFLRVMAEPDLPEDEVLQWVRTPRDIVRCTWTESPTARNPPAATSRRSPRSSA